MATKNSTRLQTPDALDFDQLMQTIKTDGQKYMDPLPPPERGMLRGMGDVGLALGQGAVGAFKSLTDLAGADNPVSGVLQSANDGLQGLKSDQSKAISAESQRRVQEAEANGSVGDQVKAYVDMLVDQPGEMLAQGVGSFATLGIGKIAGALKMAQAAKAAGMSKEAFLKTKAGAEIIKAASEAAFKTNVAVGTAQGVGAIKGAQYEQTYNNAKAQGMSDEDAKALATKAQEYGGQGAMQQLLGGALGHIATSTGPIERLIAGGQHAAGGIGKGLAKGFAVEGLTEGAQGAQERYAGNDAAIASGVLGEEGRWRGVAGQGVMEGTIGGILGAGGGAIEGYQGRGNVPQVAPAPTPQQAANQVRAQKLPESGPMTRAANAQTEAVAQKVQAAAEASANVVDSPFADRVLGVRDMLADENNRAAIRAKFGDEALNEATYYANLADRADAGLPEKTRDNMLSLAEKIIADSLLTAQSGQDLTAIGGVAPERVGFDPSAGQRQIGFDTTPSGRMRAGQDGIAPETRAQMSDAMRRAQEMDALGKAQGVRSDGVIVPPYTPLKPVPQVAMPERRNTDGVMLDLPANDPVRDYVDGLRQVNTPAARFYVGEFDAGRITPADVQQRMQVESGKTPDQRIAEAAAQAPKMTIRPGDILNPSGEPFKTKMAANVVAKKSGGNVVEVVGGYAIRKPEVAPPKAEVAPPKAEEAPAPEQTKPTGDVLAGYPDAGLLSEDERAMLAQFEGMYQADLKGEIRQRLGLEPKDRPATAIAKKEPSEFLAAIIRAGGIKSSIASDVTGVNSVQANRKFPGLFRRNGKNLDVLVHEMKGHGYLTQDDEDSNTDNGGVNKLTELIQAELAGERIKPIGDVGGFEARRDNAMRADMDSKAFALGLNGDLVAGMSNERLSGTIKRIEARLGHPIKTDFATRKMSRAEARAEREAILAADRIERVRQKYDAEIQAFAESDDRVQDAVLEVVTDEDGNIEIVSSKDVEAENAAMQMVGQWSDQNEQAATTTQNSGPGQDTRQAGPPVARAEEAGAGDTAANRAEAGAGSQEGLTTYTPEEAKAKQEAQAKAEREAKTRKDAEERAAKDADERKRIAQASVKAADTFELGQDPMYSLTGQEDIFGGATEQAQQAEDTNPFEHSGLKIQQSRVKMDGDVKTVWVVQSPENAEREARGERQIGGDSIAETREQAIATTESDAASYAERKSFKEKADAEEAAAKAKDEARKEANRGKSVVERRRDAILDKPSTVGKGTKREVIEAAVRNGRAIVQKMVFDSAAKKRDQDAVARVSRAGYILGLSNENIPAVKAGLEAQARLKANKYEKPEYRIYSDGREDGPFQEITKTEFDYAQSLIAEPAANPAERPSTYIKGDRAEYTGKVEQISGRTFYEVEFTEGTRQGQKAVTQRSPSGEMPAQPEANAKVGLVPQISGNPEKFIKVAADSVQKLRAVDVDRVVTETPRWFRAEVAEHIKDKRPDLTGEVDDVMTDLRAEKVAPVAPAQPSQADTATATATPETQPAATKLAKRNIWIPNMTPRKLNAILAKQRRTADDIEDLKDFRYFLLTDEQSATEKGFYQQYMADGGSVSVLKNKFWLTNIEAAIADGVHTESKQSTKLTQSEAQKLTEWQDMGQRDGVKTHALHFYESQADKDAKRGRMTLVTVSKDTNGANAWQINGEGQKFGALAMAKKQALDVGMGKAVADGFVDGVAAKTDAPKADESVKPIEDAGEKIGGARKDRWKERGLNMSDLDAMTESEGAELATKANVWKPDYEALTQQSDPVTAATVKVIYDRLAAKPAQNTPTGRRQYVEMMQAVRRIYGSLTSAEGLKNARTQLLYGELKWTEGRAGDSAWAARNAQGVDDLASHMKAAKEKLFSIYKGRSDPFVIGYNELQKIKKMVSDGFPAKGEPWKTRLTVSTRREGGQGATEAGIAMYTDLSAEVGTPLTRQQIEAGFYRVRDKQNKTVAFAPTREDAEAAAKTIYERDMKGGKDGRPEPERPHLDELKRENLPQRIDRDVTAEDFVKDLGFRGVEFGNWSAQDERQRILNMAYDGLMDLAEIMGVPPKAMSLNGTLGMAFGARGGGRFAAHYEPGKLVINMTKIRGGGSMAHEWAHAMDHYFGELGKPDAYTTQARGASGWYSEDQYQGIPRKPMERIGNEWKNVEALRLENLRPELARAFDEVMLALFKEQMTKAEMVRSSELDLERTKALAQSEENPELKAMYQRMAKNKAQALDELRQDPKSTLYANRGRSQYAKNAQALSGKSVNGYWVRPTEMFARAFESWVFDRVTAMGAKSDYLVHGVEGDRFAGGEYKGNPYPTGEERARINAAFDKLAATIQTKDGDDGNVIMFSRGKDAEAARAALAKIMESGVTSPDDLRDLLRVPGYSQWAKSTIAGDMAASAALRSELQEKFTGSDWRGPKLNQQGIITIYPEWSGLTRENIKSLTEIADKYDAPIAVRGGASNPRPSIASSLLGNGFERYNGLQERADGLPSVMFGWIRPAGGITATTPLFSQVGSPAKTSISTDAAQQVVNGITSNWENAPDVVVLSSMQDPNAPAAVRDYDMQQRSQGATGEPEGFWYKGKAYIVASALNGPSDVARVLFHEALGHYGLRGVFGEGLALILKQIAALRRSEVAAKAKEYGLDMGIESERLQAAEEVLAEMAQTSPSIGFVRRAVATVKAWLRKHIPGFGKMAMTDDEIISQFILPARNFVVNGGPSGGPGGGVRFNRASDQTQTPEFKAWFGDSKVVDADGKPLVVYHGTAYSFDEFDPDMAGATYGADDEGIFFTTDTEEADVVSIDARNDDNEHQSGSNVMPVFLSIKNPMEVSFDEFTWQSWEIPSATNTYDAHKERILSKFRAGDEDWNAYDGIVIAGKDGHRTFVVFNPTQIKSAIGNRGTFDPANPDIRFSRTATDVLRSGANAVRGMRLPANYIANDFMQSHGKVGWWHKTVGTMFDLAKRNPAFKPVFDRAQEFLHDVSYFASEAANLAPRILPKLETLADIAKTPLSAEDNKAIAAPIFEGTLIWTRDEDGKLVKIDDTMAEDDKFSAGVVFTPKELQDTFGLTGELGADGKWTGQIGLYQEFRAAVDKSLSDMAKADMLRIAGSDVLPDARDAILDADSLEDAYGQLKEAVSGGLPMTDATKQKMAEIGAAMGRAKALIANGYAPLSRFGSYTVDVVSSDGERVYFGLFESQREANKMARQMAVEHPGAEISQGTMSQEQYRLFAGVTPETAELFGKMMGLEEDNEAFQSYVALAKSNRSAMKRLLHRKGIAGFSEDPGRVLAGFVYSNARNVASGLHMGAMTEAAANIPKSQGELKDIAVNLVDYVKTPQEEAQKLRGILFAQYLGGNISSAILNAMQSLQVTFPWMAQHTSIANAAKTMTKAASDVAMGAKLDADLQEALTWAEESGIVSPQEVFHLQAQAAGRAPLEVGDGTRLGDASAKANNALSKVMLAWGKLFGVAEQFNRRVAFVAAYRLAVEKGINDPRAFASSAVDETQFVYNKANRPQWARGAIGATLFTFKSYSISYVELMTRMYKHGGPDGKKAALLGMAVLFALSGAGGLPFAEDVDDLIDGFAQRVLGRNFSSQTAKEEFFKDVLGQGGADFVMRGVTGLAGSPVALHGRLGLGNLVPGTGVFQKKQDYSRDLLEVAGPAADFFKRGLDATGKALQGDVLGSNGALATIAPTAARNAVKGLEMGSTGMYLDGRGKKVIDTTMTEAILKGLGIQPKTVSRVQESSQEVRRLIELNKIRESEIADKWAKGIFAKDADLIAEARKELKDWNKANPQTPIMLQMPQVIKRVRAMSQSKSERLAKTAPKEIRALVRQELAAGSQ